MLDMRFETKCFDFIFQINYYEQSKGVENLE